MKDINAKKQIVVNVIFMVNIIFCLCLYITPACPNPPQNPSSQSKNKPFYRKISLPEKYFFSENIYGVFPDRVFYWLSVGTQVFRTSI